VLLLHGEDDKVISPRVSKSALKHLPGAKLKTLRDGGHHLQEDDPQWVFERVSEFLLASK
jgi:pimeloyl-ACP methyl ester carboxylesterase